MLFKVYTLYTVASLYELHHRHIISILYLSYLIPLIRYFAILFTTSDDITLLYEVDIYLYIIAVIASIR